MADLALHFADDGSEVSRVVVGPMANNVFFLRCRITGEALMIDAANEGERLLGLCRDLNVKRVLTTHGHWDHIQAAPDMRKAGFEVGIGTADTPMLPAHDFTIADGDTLEVGELRVRAIHTPGHTPGSTCFKVEGSPILFSGDTLFPGGPGNTFGNAADFATIIESVDQLLFQALPDDTVVMPGHGDDTTIGTERPHLQEWIDRGW
ncbi:MAG TPA: MBL fold metallo-hydrolase [Acidimicrobiales bacterium]|nr:MBL fold metallo-hydrolase [Acidimicrobiales bacterium]